MCCTKRVKVFILYVFVLMIFHHGGSFKGSNECYLTYFVLIGQKIHKRNSHTAFRIFNISEAFLEEQNFYITFIQTYYSNKNEIIYMIIRYQLDTRAFIIALIKSNSFWPFLYLQHLKIFVKLGIQLIL